MKLPLLCLASILLTACATTTNDVRDVMEEVDLSRVKNIALHIGGEQIQTNSQGNTRIYALHHNGEEAKQVLETVARAYGFRIVDMSQADYYLELRKAVPDGGECVTGLDAARQGVTYSASVMTLGMVPSRGGFCLVTSAWLHYVVGGEPELLAEFMSNAGQIQIYAGAKDVDKYQRAVTKRDELKALEASFAGLLNVMLEEGAFD